GFESPELAWLHNPQGIRNTPVDKTPLSANLFPGICAEPEGYPALSTVSSDPLLGAHYHDPHLPHHLPLPRTVPHSVSPRRCPPPSIERARGRHREAVGVEGGAVPSKGRRGHSHLHGHQCRQHPPRLRGRGPWD